MPEKSEFVGATMEIAQEDRQQIEDIIKGMDCPRAFECYRSDFENLGEVGIVGDFKMIACIEERGHTCEFGFSFGLGVNCQCPLRNYIAKNYHRNCGSSRIPLERSS